MALRRRQTLFFRLYRLCGCCACPWISLSKRVLRGVVILLSQNGPLIGCGVYLMAPTIRQEGMRTKAVQSCAFGTQWPICGYLDAQGLDFFC